MKLQKMKKYKIGSQIIFIAVIFFTAIYVSAWTGPTQTPPNGNTSGPLNVSNELQTKAGFLYFPKWYDSNDSNNYYVNPNDQSVFNKLLSDEIFTKKIYDWVDPSYYLDPAGTSKLSKLEVVSTPTSNNDVATKAYVDSLGNTVVGSATETYVSTYVGNYFTTNATSYWSPTGTNSIYSNVSGNVGIGTTNPQYKFQVQENGRYYTLGTTKIADGSLASGYVLNTSSGINGGAFMGIDGNKKLWIESGSNSSNVKQDLILQAESGNVGIGTNDPQWQFQVGSNGNAVILDANVDTSAGIGFISNGNPVGAVFFNPSISSLLMKAYDGRNIRFQTEHTDRMTIGADGNVGIGIVYPTSKLHVVGNVKIDGTINLNGYNLMEKNDCAYKLVTNDGAGMNYVLCSSGEYMAGFGWADQETPPVYIWCCKI